MLKLFLGIFWLITGVVFLYLEVRNDRPSGMLLPWSGLAFLMSAFNFVRWGLGRWYRSAKKPTADAGAPPVRQRPVRQRPEEPPNPDFDFTSPPRPEA